jgi:hypothetical protein
VNWNGSPRSTTFVPARELQAQVLAADVAKPMAGFITVTNPAPGGGSSVRATPLWKCILRQKPSLPAHRTTTRSDLSSRVSECSTFQQPWQTRSGWRGGGREAARFICSRVRATVRSHTRSSAIDITTILDVLLLLAISITMANWISSFQRGYTEFGKHRSETRQWGWYVPNQWEVWNISDVSGPCCWRFRRRRKAGLRSRRRRRFRRVHLLGKRGWNLPAGGNL